MNKFLFIGQPRSGKNNMMIAPRTGHHYPNPLFAKWSAEQILRIKQQKGRPGIMFTQNTPVLSFSVEYWPGDARKRDMPGIMDAIFHVLERAEIVQDDAYFKNCLGWIEHPIDRLSPRLEISIGVTNFEKVI